MYILLELGMDVYFFNKPNKTDKWCHVDIHDCKGQ